MSIDGTVFAFRRVSVQTQVRWLLPNSIEYRRQTFSDSQLVDTNRKLSKVGIWSKILFGGQMLFPMPNRILGSGNLISGSGNSASIPLIIYIYKEERLCLSVSVCLNAFAQFSRYKAETLQVGRGRPGTGHGGVKNFGGAPGGWGHTHDILTL